MLRPLLIAAVLVVAAVPSPAQEAGSASATDFVRGKSDLILTIVNQAAADDVALAQKREELRAAIRDFLSYDVLSRRTLGDHWDQRTPTEQQEFVGLLRDLIETSYSRKLGTGTVEQEQYLVDYVGERSRRDRTTVEATVTVEGEEHYLEIKLQAVDGNWIVYDLVTDDVSLEESYAESFESIISDDGWDGLLNRMRERLEELREEE